MNFLVKLNLHQIKGMFSEECSGTKAEYFIHFSILSQLKDNSRKENMMVRYMSNLIIK